MTHHVFSPIQPTIKAEEVADDGKALRLMVAAGAGVPLHFLGEGETATRATAREMVGPTVRHYEHRQLYFCDMLLDLIEKAAYRSRAAGRMHRPRGGLQLSYAVADLREEDQLKVAQAAKEIMEYLQGMKDRGWITDRKAMELAYRFAGEVVDVEALMAELAKEGAAVPDESGEMVTG